MFVFRKLVSVQCLLKRASRVSPTFGENYSHNVLKTDLPDVEIPNVSIIEFLFSKTHNWPNSTATECAITNRKYTHGKIQKSSLNLSRNLRKKLKLEKDDVLGVLLPNCPEFILVVLGALQAGLIVTTLNPIYTLDELSRQLKDASTKAIVTLNELFTIAKASTSLIQTNIPILTIKSQPGQTTSNGAFNFDEFTDNVEFEDLPLPAALDLAFLPYSSGTTGLPKGVELTHYNIVANLCQFSQKELTVTQETTSTHQDVIPSVLPYFHIYGLMATCLHLYQKGCKAVTLPKFTPELYLSSLRAHKPDVLFVVPPIVLFLTAHPSVTFKDFENVRTAISGAAPLGSCDEERFLQKTQKDINIIQGLGMTETSPLITMTRTDLKSLQIGGSTGRPVSHTSLKVVDPNDSSNTPLGPNQVGEMLVKGPQLMRGYKNRPKETREVLTEDGWLRTGDMIEYNNDKVVFVKDRLKELIKVKGFQVPPAELEEVIRSYPGVEDVGVVGIPHQRDGEVPRAFVVGQIDTKKLDQFVASKVAPYKKLTGGIEIVASIPKNTTGKILRRILKEEYEAKLK